MSDSDESSLSLKIVINYIIMSDLAVFLINLFFENTTPGDRNASPFLERFYPEKYLLIEGSPSL